MKVSLSENELLEYVALQLENFFPDKVYCKDSEVKSALSIALQRVEKCFKHIILHGYRTESGEANFSHMHTDQYSQFLYYFSNTLWTEYQRNDICDKIIALNKMLNGMFYSYKCKLPDIFLFGHPVGSVIGNADYSDYLVIFQNVTINTNFDADGNAAPKLGKGLFLGSGAKIIGNKSVGDRVSLGVDAVVYNQEIPDNSIVLKDSYSGKQILKTNIGGPCKAQSFFDAII